MKGGIRVAAGATLAGLVHQEALGAQQLSPPEPLQDSQITFITTTEADPWQNGSVFKPAFSWDLLNLNVSSADTPLADRAALPIEGFGACFSDQAWTSLTSLSEQDRQSILHELFDPKAGAHFSYCRMPIGANDFATEAYTYDETDGDFELKHFTIEHDRKTLIPFIHAAQRYQPKLRIWASPWTPPIWMKRNRFYAGAKPHPGMPDNGIRPDQLGREGEDMFLLEPRYFDAYARYFGRFIDAYRAEGIQVDIVMPQNEFNSPQSFPSCAWTPDGLARFIHYLGPEMQKRNVDIFLGTLERGNPKMLSEVMANKNAARYIKGVGVQWAGKNALPAIRREFPSLNMYQTEQECGDSTNSWSYTGYCWQLMKHYFRSGTRAYMYWNISLDQRGKSTWGWPQNSLVTVNSVSRTYHFNHDYYLLKHFSHFVDVGAKCIETTGTCDDALAFQNPDGATILMLRNELSESRLLHVQTQSRSVTVKLLPDSMSTLVIKQS